MGSGVTCSCFHCKGRNGLQGEKKKRVVVVALCTCLLLLLYPLGSGSQILQKEIYVSLYFLPGNLKRVNCVIIDLDRLYFFDHVRIENHPPLTIKGYFRPQYFLIFPPVGGGSRRRKRKRVNWSNFGLVHPKNS